MRWLCVCVCVRVCVCCSLCAFLFRATVCSRLVCVLLWACLGGCWARLLAWRFQFCGGSIVASACMRVARVGFAGGLELTTMCARGRPCDAHGWLTGPRAQVDALYVAWGQKYLYENFVRPHVEAAQLASALPRGTSDSHLVRAISRALFKELFAVLGGFAQHVAFRKKEWAATGRTPAVVIACDTGIDDSSMCPLIVGSSKGECLCVCAAFCGVE